MNLECSDVNIVVRQYYASLLFLLDKHAPSKRSYVVDRLMNDWMTDDILVLKALRRKYESLWRNTRLTVHFDMYSESCIAVKKQLVRVHMLYCSCGLVVRVVDLRPRGCRFDAARICELRRCASKITHNQYGTICRFQPHPRECIYASSSIISLSNNNCISNIQLIVVFTCIQW